MRQYFCSTIAEPTITSVVTSPSTTKTALFSPVQANTLFPIPYGQSAPCAGQIFRYTMGGIVTLPSNGTLTLDCFYGPGTSTTAFGTSMVTGAAQTITTGGPQVPWRLKGEVIFLTISPTATSSTVWATGQFETQGTLATAGGGMDIIFGSTAAVSVDTTGTGIAGTFGALNFAVSFSAISGTVTVAWTSMQALN